MSAAGVDWEAVRAAIAEAVGAAVPALQPRPVAGGCINAAYRCEAGELAYFVKTNTREHAEVFAAEGDALDAIAATGTLRVPRPVASGLAGGTAFLVLEFLDLTGGGGGDPAAMGDGLAALHACGSEDGRFGWHRDNAIGATPQANAWHADWPTFYAQRRLAPQLALAEKNGYRFGRGDELVARVPEFFPDGAPPASLLHGDLWGGNAGFDAMGRPVVFDPASYYGDAEADLAFTRMFGGFPPDFYRAYDRARPPRPGRDRRIPLYNLYHTLNHLNLFGGSYAGQAERMVVALLE